MPNKNNFPKTVIEDLKKDEMLSTHHNYDFRDNVIS